MDVLYFSKAHLWVSASDEAALENLTGKCMLALQYLSDWRLFGIYV